MEKGAEKALKTNEKATTKGRKEKDEMEGNRQQKVLKC